MTRKASRHRAGLGLTLLFGATALLLGVGLDFATVSGSRFWIAERPGAMALFGVGVAVAVVVIAQGARLLLRRRELTQDTRRHADA